MPRAMQVLVSAVLAASQVAAHHGVSGTFDESRTIKIAGVVKKMDMVNPHAWVTLLVANKSGGSEAWSCEMRAGALLRRSGWTEAMFTPGTPLYIVAAPHWTDPHKCYVETITFQDGRVLERYEQLATADKGDVKRQLRTPEGRPNLAGNWGARQMLNAVNNGTNTPEVLAAVRAGRTPPVAAKLSTTEVVYFGDFSRAPSNFVTATAHEAPNAAPARGMGAAPPPVAAARGAVGMAPGGEVGVPPEAGGPGGRGGQYRQSAAGLAASAAAAGAARQTCAASSLFSDWTKDQHINRIQQTKDTIKIDYGFLDISRTIHLNMTTHPKDVPPSKWGHSIGRWDGDTLIVDTTGFLAGPIAAGIMHSDRFHLVERFTMSADGRQLTRSWVGEDPLYLTEPFRGQDVVEISQTPFEPYNCKDLTASPVA